MRFRLTVLALILVIAEQGAHSCSLLASGYFYQVTHLRGKVVGFGSYWPGLGHHSYPRWVRHSFTKAGVTLRLFQYAESRRDWNDPVATVRTDKRGRFDFGQIPRGHHTLAVDWPSDLATTFDVEITYLSTETPSVLIDASGVDPDCSGGQEFIVNRK